MSLSVSKLSVIYRTEHTLIHALDEVDLELAPGALSRLKKQNHLNVKGRR